MIAVDLFAGWGGFTLGAELAGVRVAWAANHWPLAVQAHALNHPRTEHACQDLRQADWTRLPRFDLLLASPACQGHSTASQPMRRLYHDELRATAWAVVDCADVTEPRAIVVENVPAFLRWRLFPVWLQALTRLGYTVTLTLVRASRLGVPQRRDRLFVVAARGRAVDLCSLPAAADEPPFEPCIEPVETATWRPISAASPNAQRRFASARERLGARFLSQHVTGHRGVPTHEPIRTITTKDQWVLVDGDRYRSLTVRETARAMGFPDSYTWPIRASRRDLLRGLGNAVPPPVARAVVGFVASAVAA